MKVIKVEADGYRNLKNITLTADPQMNILYGQNAQGKTNLIELIGLFATGKSFRGAKDAELLGFGREFAKCHLTFSDAEREQKAELILSQTRQYKRNGVKQPLREKNSGFSCVVFTPRHLSLVNGGPQERRDFLDAAITACQPEYGSYLAQYEKLLRQRNALLKELWKTPSLESTIPLWDLQIARAGTVLTIFRNDYIKKLYQTVKELYHGMTGGKEELSLSYSSTVFGADLPAVYESATADFYEQRLSETLEDDKKAGFTTVGIHRDDMVVEINGISARQFGSQGQQRSAAVCCKLGEATLLRQVLGEPPVMLLDDVMSELDSTRQEYICNKLKQMQVFLTCCDISQIMGLDGGKVFHINDGTCSEQPR